MEGGGWYEAGVVVCVGVFLVCVRGGGARRGEGGWGKWGVRVWGEVWVRGCWWSVCVVRVGNTCSEEGRGYVGCHFFAIFW